MILPLSFLCLLSSNIPNGVIWVLAFIICVLHSYLIFFMDVKPPKKQWLLFLKFHSSSITIIESCSLFCFVLGLWVCQANVQRMIAYLVNLPSCNFEPS